MTLGKNVKRLRELAGVALEPMAEAMGMDRAAGRQKIYALEARASKKSEIAPKLAEYFGISLDSLLSEDLSQLSLEDWEARKSAHHRSQERPGDSVRPAKHQLTAAKDVSEGHVSPNSSVLPGSVQKPLSPNIKKLVEEIAEAGRQGKISPKMAEALRGVLRIYLYPSESGGERHTGKRSLAEETRGQKNERGKTGAGKGH